MSDIVSIVWKILYGPPIDIVDDEQEPAHLHGVLELVLPRSFGEYAGSREIGSANIITAYNIVHMKKLQSNKYDDLSTLELYKQVLDSLSEDRLIRKKPEVVRETFKVVDNG